MLAVGTRATVRACSPRGAPGSRPARCSAGLESHSTSISPQFAGSALCRFGADGYIDLMVRNFQYWHQGAMDLTQIGFFVTTLEAEAQLEIDLAQVRSPPWRACVALFLTPRAANPWVAADSLQSGSSQLADCARCGWCAQGACALDANNVIKLLTFDAVDTNRKAGHDATALNVHLPELVRDYAGGEYSLFFANCQARGPGPVQPSSWQAELLATGPLGLRACAEAQCAWRSTTAEEAESVSCVMPLGRRCKGASPSLGRLA